jgi:cullin-associated NEDD8-dissociated protein 1
LSYFFLLLQLVSHFGDCPALTQHLPGLFSLLQRRLENETTRSASLRAMAVIASSTHPPNALVMNLAGLLDGAAVDLSLFLRQTSRNLKQLALQALDALLLAPSTCLSESVCAAVTHEAAGLLTDGDLHLAQLTLSLVHSLVVKAEATQQVSSIDVNFLPHKIYPN